MRAFVLICALSASSSVLAQTSDLSSEIEARVLKTAEAELGRVERALRAQSGVDGTQITNITLPLQLALEEDLGRGPVKVYPKAIFEACLSRLKQGQHGDQIGKSLVELHRSGDLMRAAGGSVSTEPKRVASFVFDKERLRSPDPHLPSNMHAQHGEKLRGVYLICVGTDGKVSRVTTVQSLSGGDSAIMEQIQATWLYKPQPVPVCTPRAFVFQFE